jgi:L-asparaginase/Glu-tRNA(Gln) amidotransferase subunit D
MSDWIKIATDIEVNYELFDAFIVLHGTDTMAYTASALSFMLEDLGKTVILTGSQVSSSSLMKLSGRSRYQRSETMQSIISWEQ